MYYTQSAIMLAVGVRTTDGELAEEGRNVIAVHIRNMIVYPHTRTTKAVYMCTSWMLRIYARTRTGLCIGTYSFRAHSRTMKDPRLYGCSPGIISEFLPFLSPYYDVTVVGFNSPRRNSDLIEYPGGCLETWLYNTQSNR